MALTYSQYVGDGSTRAFAVTFPYISKSHVKVRVDGLIVPFTWASSTLIQINPAPNAGSVIDVRRETPNTEALVDFHDGSTLVESDLDLSTLQTLYIAQELVDTLNQKLGVDTDGTINASTRRIKNVGVPRDATDAATKGYVDDITGNAPAYAAQAKTDSETASAQAGIATTKAGEASSSATAAAASAAQALENSRKAVTPFYWTAVAGQKDFFFGQTIDPALVLVFVNGAKFPLGMGDYSINSTKITLAREATAGDIVEAYVFAPFSVANALTPANNLAELADKAAARANLGIVDVPVGAIIAFPSLTLPSRFLVADGSEKSRLIYADLFSVIGTAYGAGDGENTFNLPDLRGMFIRGLDSGRGLDPGRALGTQQGDAIRNITGTIYNGHGNYASSTGPFSVQTASTKTISGSMASGLAQFTFDASKAVPTAEENRPVNVALVYCIRY